MFITLAERNRLISANQWIAERAAWWAKRRLPRWIEFDDVKQSAVLGLVMAAKSFDPSRGVPFEVYAPKRIYGAAINPFSGKHCRDYLHTQLPGFLVTVELPEAERMLGNSEIKRLLRRALLVLPTQTRRIIVSRHCMGIPMVEIARALDIPISRARQLETHGLTELRHELIHRWQIRLQGPGRVSDLLLPSERALAELAWSSPRLPPSSATRLRYRNEPPKNPHRAD